MHIVFHDPFGNPKSGHLHTCHPNRRFGGSILEHLFMQTCISSFLEKCLFQKLSKSLVDRTSKIKRKTWKRLRDLFKSGQIGHFGGVPEWCHLDHIWSKMGYPFEQGCRANRTFISVLQKGPKRSDSGFPESTILDQKTLKQNVCFWMLQKWDFWKSWFWGFPKIWMFPKSSHLSKMDEMWSPHLDHGICLWAPSNWGTHNHP